MSGALKSLINGAKALAMGRSGSKARIDELFPKVNKAVDGEDCDRDCESCSVQYPRGFKIDESDDLYGFVKGWSTHVLVATGKTDWVRDVADEKGSVMQAIANTKGPTNGRLMLSASNMPTPHNTTSYSEPTTVLLLPAFVLIDNVTPATVPTLIDSIVSQAPTTTSPLRPFRLPRSLPAPLPESTPAAIRDLTTRPCPHRALILLCSQKTRDARCGQSAPLLRKEFQRHLQPLGLYRDLDDERPGGVGIYFISHVGGHKYSANVIIYRRAGFDGGGPGGRKKKEEEEEEGEEEEKNKEKDGRSENKEGQEQEEGDLGAAQCIWLARVRPEDCEGIVKFTVLQGKVVKPERQLRGGFDREKGLLSW
ncbi:Sucrase/ferredoxin-like-domain-containing protein [Thermothelomyces heterothallicus CBS 202.75]|uniref:Sucrase/ferredoxin-like-domain-containing protein n=1 Tax=Thermothelomyces heterothallicus CBS 202.75 TaxID=1149848 RepID=UPI0037443AA5